MAQTQNLFQDGISRVQTTLRSLERDFERLQKKADARRRELEKRAEREVRRLQAELRRSPLLRRAEDLGTQARRRLDEQVESLLGSLRIARQTDVARLERKVNALGRKLRALEKERAEEDSRAA